MTYACLFLLLHFTIRPQKKKKKKKEEEEEEKKPWFTGGWTFQVGSVGWDNFFIYFFLFGGKNDSPKHQNLPKIWFYRKILEKYFQLFSKLFSQIFFAFGKKRLI